jgi:hypothetical protein
MTFLSRDISRCAGVIFGDNPITCQERDSCLRYIAFTKTDKQQSIENYMNISVMSMMCKDNQFQSKIERSSYDTTHSNL